MTTNESADITPRYDFTFDDSLKSWDLPVQKWLKQNQQNQQNQQNPPLDGLATGCAVFNPEGRILLIQRAAHDSMPHRWEIPGGAVDLDDKTILHGAARELWEESGLIANHFSHAVSEGADRLPGFVFHTRRGTFCRFCFLVEVDDGTAVKLDPNEHQDFGWASEDEVRSLGPRQQYITTDSMVATILEAFRLRRLSGGLS